VCFQVCPLGAFYSLSRSGISYAILNKKTGEELKQLQAQRPLRLTAYVKYNEWEAAWRNNSHSGVISFDINLYGRREDAIEVGDTLRNFGICLQQPDHGLESASYYNPHFFHAQEVSGQTVLETPLVPREADPGDSDNTPQNKSDPRGQDEPVDPRKELESILDSLSHHNVLHERKVDNRIRTKLMRYESIATRMTFHRNHRG